MTVIRKPRLLTGDRPTGPLHLGHLVGTLQNRVALQDSHECFIIVADLHSLTTRSKREQITELPGLVRSMVLDLLSVGIDPARSTIYLQSGVPAVYDLAILLQMLTPVARLSKIDTIKDMARSAGLSDSEVPIGLLGYPVLQAADILMANAELVPVGGDNEIHVQVARELAEHFNEAYGPCSRSRSRPSRAPPSLPGVNTIPGGSARKMSKSLGNSDQPRGLLRGGRPQAAHPPRPRPRRARAPAAVRLRRGLHPRGDRGPAPRLRPRRDRLRRRPGPHHHAPSRTCSRRSASVAPRFAADRGRVEEIVVDGTITARKVAYETLARVREAMGLEPLWAGLVQATQARAEARKRPVYPGRGL
jgi:tryptophanyl-tRNA synthetase